jgi:integrase
VQRLIAAVPPSNHQERDRLIILLGFLHGMRAVEICNLRWDDIELDKARITIRRVKRGDDSRQPLTPKEMKAIRSHQRHQLVESAYVFTGWTSCPLDRSSLWGLINKIGKLTNLGFSVHPHMLRHSTGYHLGSCADIRTIQALLGHKNISHTVRYVAMNEDRYKGLFKD